MAGSRVLGLGCRFFVRLGGILGPRFRGDDGLGGILGPRFRGDDGRGGILGPRFRGDDGLGGGVFDGLGIRTNEFVRSTPGLGVWVSTGRRAASGTRLGNVGSSLGAEGRTALSLVLFGGGFFSSGFFGSDFFEDAFGLLHDGFHVVS